MDPTKTGNVDLSSNGWRLLAASTSTVTIAFLFVLARMYTKIRITRAVGWEDYFCIFALVTAIVRTGLDWSAVRLHHLGIYTKLLTKDDLQGLVPDVSSSGLLYLVAITAVKLSILLFLMRLFGVNKKLRYTSWILTFIITVWAVVTLLLCISAAGPS